MASKKDLIEAQGFSRRRLITAFTSGGAGTKELEPAKPLRAVVAGTALAALVVVGSAFSHLISPALPEGWDNGKLVVATDTGARFVSSAGTLYPVPNTASARLLLPAGQFDVVATTSQHLAQAPLGPAVGIPGAPEALPATDRLLDSGWTACTGPATHGQASGLTVQIAAQPPAQVAQDAVLVRAGEQVWLVQQGRRYEVDPGRRDQVLRGLGLADATPVDLDERWINLFEPGAPLRPFTLPGAGGAVLGTSLRAGQVVHPTSMGPDETFLVGTDGSLAPLSPFALRLYRIDAPSDLGQPSDVDPAEIETLPNATQAAGSTTWPHAVPELMTSAPCALTVRDGNRAATVLAASVDPAAAGPAHTQGGTAVLVDPGAGALVRTAATDDGQSAERTYLVDATGTAYPVPDAEAVARLGYGDVTIPTLAPGWIALLPAGPELSVSAAGRGLAENQTPAGQEQ